MIEFGLWARDEASFFQIFSNNYHAPNNLSVRLLYQYILQNTCIWNIMCWGGHEQVLWSPCGPSIFFPKYFGTSLLKNSQQGLLLASITNRDHMVIEMELHQPKPISLWVWALLSGMGWNVWVKVKFGRDERPKIVIVKSLEMNWKFKTQMARLVSVKCY